MRHLFEDMLNTRIVHQCSAKLLFGYDEEHAQYEAWIL